MTTDPIGGVWTYGLELARGLAQHGIEVCIATMGRPLRPAQREEAKGISSLRLYESNFKLEWMEDPWADLTLAGKWLLELEAEVQPDLIHLNGYIHGALPWSAPVVVVGHSCVLSWWQAVHAEEAPASWDRYRAKVKEGIQAADLVLAPSQTMLLALERYYGGLPAAVFIYNGRDLSEKPNESKANFVLGAGRLWDEAKNLSVLADLSDQLSWPVYLAGEFEFSPHLSRFTGAHLLGPLPARELLGWFARAAIYALPARYEPFGLTALEAALSGCALVLGDIPSLREIWGDAALFAPPDNRGALRSILTELMSDQGRVQAWAGRARERAQRFTRARMASDYLQAYQRVLSPASPPRDGGFRVETERRTALCAS
jgi:glycosyltransferase involved in cell wall biosynthesis